MNQYRSTEQHLLLAVFDGSDGSRTWMIAASYGENVIGSASIVIPGPVITGYPILNFLRNDDGSYGVS